MIDYLNKLKVNTASCWFILYGYMTMHGQQNMKLLTSVPQNEPTGLGQWQTFYNLKPKVKPKGKDDVLKT
jgi:hypothetical protein